jgi:hypothetical protein
MTKGTMPPKTNTACHPPSGMSTAEISPPSTAPPVKPHDTHIISVTRRRCGLYSLASALALAMMPPRPMPVMKRIASNWSSVCVKAVASMHSAKNTVAPSSTGRRPMRSAQMLSTSEPTSMPKRPAPNTGPSAALSMPQALHDGRRDEAHGLHVEAVHHHRAADQQQDPFLEAADGVAVDQRGNVDGGRCAATARARFERIGECLHTGASSRQVSAVQP